MIAITSISPTHVHAGIQQKAINSWNNLGFKCYSFNSEYEIRQLKSRYKGIEFVETSRTMEAAFGKPYVSISAMIDWAKVQEEDRFCLINSDIELVNDQKLLAKIEANMDSSVIVSNRFDYGATKKKSVQYIHGIDVFFLNKKHLSIYPPSLFCMGQCFWDYYIPFTALKNNIPVIVIQNEFAFHKRHAAQYSTENWEKTGKYFAVEHDLDFETKDIGRMNELLFNFLNLNMIKKTL